tara:strand:+ start:95 stop:940 length:846 start_codon:yes stop_codon:yes gene_type:complete
MGTPRIYWYPAGSLVFETITLPHVSAVNVSQFRDVVDAEGPTMARLDRGGGRIVTIRGRYNVASHSEAIRGLLSLDSHLRAGGRIAFALDSDRMFASRLVFPAFSGKSSLNVDVNALPFETTTLVANDELLIQQTMPLRYERVAMSGNATAASIGFVLPLKRNLYYEHPPHTIVRSQYAYPALYMDAAGANSPTSFISDERHPGLIYDMELTLVELPLEIELLVDATLGTSNRQLGEGGVSLDDAVKDTTFTGMVQTTYYRPVTTDQFTVGFTGQRLTSKT